MRAALVDAAESLIREQGCTAVSARTLADKVGLTRQIVHYYFETMDDVFIALVRRNLGRLRETLSQVGRDAEPLRALQALCRDPSQTILAIELYALANRRPAVRAAVVAAASESRQLQTAILEEHLKARGIEPSMPPVVATILLTSLAQALALEAAIGFTSGHAQTLKFVDSCLRAFAKGERTPFPAMRGPSAGSRKPGRARGSA
jgi:TetR/AcrR family transcriptional regulator